MKRRLLMAAGAFCALYVAVLWTAWNGFQPPGYWRGKR